MSEESPPGGYKLLLVPERDIAGYASDDPSKAYLSLFGEAYEVAADVPEGVTAHAIASAVAALRIGMATTGKAVPDWTINARTGRSNSSALFGWLRAEIAQIIRGGAAGAALSRDWVDGKAGLIAAQLVHVHGLAPAAQEAERA